MSPASSQGNTTALSISPENAGRSATVTESFLRLLSHVKVENLVAGLSGGVVSTLILHPLDLVKIRFAGKITNVIFAACWHDWQF